MTRNRQKADTPTPVAAQISGPEARPAPQLNDLADRDLIDALQRRGYGIEFIKRVTIWEQE